MSATRRMVSRLTGMSSPRSCHACNAWSPIRPRSTAGMPASAARCSCSAACEQAFLGAGPCDRGGLALFAELAPALQLAPQPLGRRRGDFLVGGATYLGLVSSDHGLVEDAGEAQSLPVGVEKVGGCGGVAEGVQLVGGELVELLVVGVDADRRLKEP